MVMMAVFLSFAISQKNQSIDFVSGMNITYRYLSSNPGNPNTPVIIKTRNKRERPNFNWTIGFNYNKNLGENYVFKSGIRLSKLGYNIKIQKESLLWPSQISNPNDEGEDIGDIKLYYNYLYAEIPVAIRYEGSKKRFTPYIEVGFTPMWLLQNSRHFITDSMTNVSFGPPNNAKFNRIQIAAILSFGYNYQFNETIQIFAQPTIRYHLTKLVDAPISEFLYSSGLEFGVRKSW